MTAMKKKSRIAPIAKLKTFFAATFPLMLTVTVMAGPSAAFADDRPAAGKKLTFVLYAGMHAGTQAQNNPMCFSKVITVDGPPGYGLPGFGDRAADEKAHKYIQSHFDDFVKLCALTADGKMRKLPVAPPGFEWNRHEQDKPERTLSRSKQVKEDVIVDIQVR